MSGRCEPPAEWRERGGWHFVQINQEPSFITLWRGGEHSVGRYQWSFSGRFWTSEEASRDGWSYLHPVSQHDPAAVARLVEALRAVVNADPPAVLDVLIPRLRAALTAFGEPTKEPPTIQAPYGERNGKPLDLEDLT